MAFRLKHQKPSPINQRFVSSGGRTDEVNAMNKMLAERAAASGIQPRQPDTVKAVEGKKGLSGMKEAAGDFVQSLKTIVGNPFDAARAILRTDDSGGDFPNSVKDLTVLRELADRDDGSENSKQAKSILSPSSGFNAASAMVGPALTAQTFLDLATGDPAAAILGKAKKLKPVAKTLKKTKLGQQLKNTVLPSSYIGYKAEKQGKKIG